jgi:hypothetical protein
LKREPTRISAGFAFVGSAASHVLVAEMEVGIFGAIVLPAALILTVGVSDDLHCCTIRSQLVRHDNFWLASRFIVFLRNFNATFRSRRFVS